MSQTKLTVFTKPWQRASLEELADLVVQIGADGVELPVRDGYQVTPDDVAQGLPRARKAFEDKGLSIGSVAGSLDAPTIRAMGESGVPILRVCVGIDMQKGYMTSVAEYRQQILDLQPVLEEAGVSVGIQNHYGASVGSALGIHHLLAEVPADCGSAVLDFAHCALDGEPVPMAFDIVRDRISLVNFKNACWVRTNGPDEDEATWEVLWTTGRQGGYSWSQAVQTLKQGGYTGDICLPAEYSRIGQPGQLMEDEVIPRVSADIAYLRSLISS